VVLRFLARLLMGDGRLGEAELGLLLRVAGTMAVAEAAAHRIVDEERAAPSDPSALARALAEPAHLRSVFALGCLLAIEGDAVPPARAALLAAFARGGGLTEEEAREILVDAIGQTRSVP
jgi:hypothetical protein